MKTELTAFRRTLHNNQDLVMSSVALNQSERFILIESYCKGLRSNATKTLAKTLNYSERSVKRIRRDALEKLYINSVEA
jgi:DNA-binding CsgD family transcriptional regulator